MPIEKTGSAVENPAPASGSASGSARGSAAGTVADAVPGSWVYRWVPDALLPYFQLARFDRPIGAWLLMFPCWWSLALAELSQGKAYPSPWYLALFVVGAIVMRAAGCTYNDIVDRDIDAEVLRTASRPIPAGKVSVSQALMFGAALCLAGLAVLIQFNAFTIYLGLASLAPFAIYPFMKRVTYWPQLVLGLTFNWGALVGWSAAHGTLELPALALYAGCILWTIGYDTIYAHQDKEDDLSLGLKSTALRFGDKTRGWVSGFYAGAWLLWAFAAALAGAGWIFFTALSVVAMQLGWQVLGLDSHDPADCLARFRSNRNVGLVFFAGVVADTGLRALLG